MTFTKALLKAESSSAEHFGAISSTFVYRVVWADPADTPATAAALADLLDQGLAGIAARPGRPLVVDETTYQALTTRTVDVQPNEAGGLDVTVGCTRYNWADDSVGDPAVRVMVTPSTTSVQAWRVDPIVPSIPTAQEFDDAAWADPNNGLKAQSTAGPPSASDPNQTYRPAGDIGGVPIDWNGNPATVLIPTMRLEIEVFRRGGFINVSGDIVADSLDHDTVKQYLGTRNNLAFAGFEVGSLLFDGCNRSRLDGEWTVCTFSFLWHPWRHAQQVPRPTFGTDAGSISYEGDPRSIGHMRGVYWKQPFLQSANFNTGSGDGLFTDDELVQIDGYLPA